MRLAILVDSSTNRLSCFALDVQLVLQSRKVAGKYAFGGLEWLRMSSNDWTFRFGDFQSPSMSQAVLGNAEVASRMLEGLLKRLECD